MKKKLFVIFTALILAVTFMPAVASADFSVNGWADNGSPTTSFDKMELFIRPDLNTNGVTWSGNGVTNFRLYNNQAAVLGWSATQINSGYVLATGPTFTGGSGSNYPFLQWDMSFAGSVPVTVDYLFWSPGGSAPNSGARMWSTDGSVNWNNYVALTTIPTDYNRSPVPIPAAVYLLGTGLVGLFGVRRRLTS